MKFDGIDDLTDPQRSCLRAYFASRSYKAAARTLNISIEAVKDRLERARRTLGVTDSYQAAYALAVAEGHVTPPTEGWPPSQGLAPPAHFPPDMSLPLLEAPAKTRVCDSLAPAPLPDFGEPTPREGSHDEHLSNRLPAISSRVLRSAEIIALIIVLAWIAMAAISNLRPGFFRILDNLHS